MFSSLKRADDDDIMPPGSSKPTHPLPSVPTATPRITVEGGTLTFHNIGGIEGEELRCTFNRTNRLAYEGGPYGLPPGLGNFSLSRVEDYSDQVIPPNWRKYGGIFFAMNTEEAFWINFSNRGMYAKAVKMGAGNLNVLNGRKWTNRLEDDPGQDYMVIGLPGSSQPWIDGHHCGPGFVRQFVATPKGSGMSVEAQLTGEEKFGGIQLLVYVAKEPNPNRSGGSGWSDDDDDDWGDWDDAEENWGEPVNVPTSSAPVMTSTNTGVMDTDDPVALTQSERMDLMSMLKSSLAGRMNCMAGDMDDGPPSASARQTDASAVPPPGTDLGEAPALNKSRSAPKKPQVPMPQEMCLAAGGKMAQNIVPDPKGIEFWNQDKPGEVLWIHLVSSKGYSQITSRAHPASPEAWGRNRWTGASHAEDTAVSPELAGVKSVGQMQAEKNGW